MIQVIMKYPPIEEGIEFPERILNRDNRPRPGLAKGYRILRARSVFTYVPARDCLVTQRT
jgi:hypothetical protein